MNDMLSHNNPRFLFVISVNNLYRSIMKTLILSLALSFISLGLYATGQDGEVIYVDGEQWELLGKPVYADSILNRELKAVLPSREERGFVTSNWSGYTAYWSIQQERLCLDSVCYDVYGSETKTVRLSSDLLRRIFKKYVDHISFFTDGRVVSLLYGSGRTLDKYLHIAVEDISQSVERIMNCSCTIGVSRTGNNISGLHELYVEAMNALSYNTDGNSSIRYISDVENDYFSDIEMFEEFVAQEERCVRGGLVKEAGAIADKLFSEIESGGKYKLSANFIVPNITSSVYKILYSVVDKEHIDKLQEKCPLQMTDLYGSIANIGSYCKRLCIAAAELVEEHCKNTGSRHCELAKEIINKEFSNPEISLVSISREIAVSPNYLSALIRKETGSTFIELLTKRRMQEAVSLLKYPALKVKDVALKCGYEDQHYFSYSFKKETGLSPIQYKKQLTESGEE